MKNVLQDECRVYTEKDFLMWKTWMWVQGILTGAGVVVVGILTVMDVPVFAEIVHPVGTLQK